ncbi:Phage portal protein, SPP1-like protein [Fructobacillus sp. EFB-N1]|uniref:phage portal protein n=1 Tax=Fructobacillus sp. EFB-N1 TaxID=1658766 RepID=UPI00064DAC3B|nr:phage portal protein [Fructobacillus sp. EFB-N1]KMK52784.1 Phage portal protein, SPP1-like protein [Fructobacillus sp. EFB-N1]
MAILETNDSYQTKAERYLHHALMQYQEDLDNLTPKRVGEFIMHHYNKQRPRLINLDSYYKGINTNINSEVSRRIDEYGADVRLGHPFAQEIVDFHTAFSVGNPINISVDQDHNGQEDEHQQLDKINHENGVNSLFYDLFSDMSKYGRAFANVYRDGDVEKITRLSPANTFMIYSNDVDPVPIMAVRYTEQSKINDDLNYQPYMIETWTDSEYNISNPVAIADGTVVNGYDVAKTDQLSTLPVVEFWNNTQRLGDFDGVISLIDAYDAAQSDTANYMQDSNDAMLVIKGDIDDLLDGADLFGNPDDEEYLEKLAEQKKKLMASIKEARTLFLKSGSTGTGQQTTVSADYIHKQYDTAGVEAYKSRLYKNIHSFSRTPDVSDENFASNASGVAMQYKQLGVIQLAKTKRRSFSKGLSEIYGIVEKLEKAASGPWQLDYQNINFMFTDNLPTDDVATIQVLQQSGASFPKEYLDRYAPGIDTSELETMRERENEPMNAMQDEMKRLQDKTSQLGDEDDDE